MYQQGTTNKRNPQHSAVLRDISLPVSYHILRMSYMFPTIEEWESIIKHQHSNKQNKNHSRLFVSHDSRPFVSHYPIIDRPCHTILLTLSLPLSLLPMPLRRPSFANSSIRRRPFSLRAKLSSEPSPGPSDDCCLKTPPRCDGAEEAIAGLREGCCLRGACRPALPEDAAPAAALSPFSAACSLRVVLFRRCVSLPSLLLLMCCCLVPCKNNGIKNQTK